MTDDKYKKEFEDWWLGLMKDMPDAKTSLDSRLDNLVYQACKSAWYKAYLLGLTEGLHKKVH